MSQSVKPPFKIKVTLLSYSVEQAVDMFRKATFAEQHAMVFYHYAILATARKAELPEIIYNENQMRSGNVADDDSYRQLVEESRAVLTDFVTLAENEGRVEFAPD